MLTVANIVVADTQGVIVTDVPESVSEVVEPIQVVRVSVMDSKTLIVTVAVILHPPLFVKVIALVPAATPVTRPV